MESEYAYNLPEDFYRANNICDLISDDELMNMGSDLIEQITRDIDSRSDWLERSDTWMKLVTQVIEEKTYPWPEASNIKFPLISTAAVQFHARSFPALLGTNRPVKCRVLGNDPHNLKAERAERLSSFLSFQVMEAMEGWIEDMDRLLFILPIIGSLYKKTYFHEAKNEIVSEMIHPRDLIINYDAIDIETARKTHRQWFLPNTVVEYQNRGLWREIPEQDEHSLTMPSESHSDVHDEHGFVNPGMVDDFSLQEFYEVHCLWDLDDDGYKEPYVVTLRPDGNIYRIVANYGDKDMELGPENDIIAIRPKDFFTHYFFLPDPESKTHGIGFGTMVGPINEAVNTLINILTDSGHMHSLGGGFLARGVRLQGGAVKFKPNEWKQINTTGDDLRKGILPLPTKEPSTVLFQLLGLLIDSGKDLSSVQDQMVGRSPGQNQPFSTTQAVMEQGMKVFNGIYKRVYRSMTREFKKLYQLNREFPDIRLYMTVLDVEGNDVKQAMQMKMPDGSTPGAQGVLEFLARDFTASDLDVVPTAEPDMVAEMEKMLKANALLEKLGQGIPLNVEAVTRRVLEAEGHENVAELMQAPPPQTPPDVQLEMDKFEWTKQKEAFELRLQELQVRAEVLDKEMQAKLAFAEAQQMEVQGIHDQWLAEKKQVREEFDSITKRLAEINKSEQIKQAAKQNSGNSSGDKSGGS